MNEAANAAPLLAEHNHGFFGEWIEQLLALTPLPESGQIFLGHTIVDCINIFALLIGVMTVVYYLSGFIRMDALHHKLEHLKSLPGFLLAIAAGVLSPFCSCSIIPVLMGLLSVGVPVSVCLCYLTASSMLNLTAVISLFAVAGPRFALFYLVGSLLIIALSCVAFSLLQLDGGVKRYLDEHHHHHEPQVCTHCFWHRVKCAFLSTLHVVKECWLYILIGVLLSSAVMAFFPLDVIARAVNENVFFSSTAVALIGFPIHSDIFSIAPVLRLLLDISFPVALAFTLSAMVLSIPSVVMLTRALKTKTVLVYCGVLAALTLAVGWFGILLV